MHCWCCCVWSLCPLWFWMMQPQRKHMMFQPVAERVTRHQQTNVTASALQTVICKAVSQPLLSASSEPACKWCPLRLSPILTTGLVPPPLTPRSVPVKGSRCLVPPSINQHNICDNWQSEGPLVLLINSYRCARISSTTLNSCVGCLEGLSE